MTRRRIVEVKDELGVTRRMESVWNGRGPIPGCGTAATKADPFHDAALRFGEQKPKRHDWKGGTQSKAKRWW